MLRGTSTCKTGSIMDSKQFVSVDPRRLWIQGGSYLRIPVDYGFKASLVCEPQSIVDSQQYFQVGGVWQHPPIGPLSLWERVRVRGLLDQPPA
ncbi:hypothetical protein DBR29_14130 [Pseudomonas sp. HMWF005]|nr:hypothetical protein DBR29_14130 [Pseudomonas sp. HMWF005]